MPAGSVSISATISMPSSRRALLGVRDRVAPELQVGVEQRHARRRAVLAALLGDVLQQHPDHLGVGGAGQELVGKLVRVGEHGGQRAAAHQHLVALVDLGRGQQGKAGGIAVEGHHVLFLGHDLLEHGQGLLRLRARVVARQPHRPAVDAAGGIQVAEVGFHAKAAKRARLGVDPGQRYRGAPHDLALVGSQRQRRADQYRGQHRRRQVATHAPHEFATSSLHPITPSPRFAAESVF